MHESLQKKYAAKSICYGCGPANQHGFKIQSFVEGETVVARYMPEAHHCAFPNVLNGGVIGTLLDCHCNWASCWFLMQDKALARPPCMVTAKFEVTLRKPTPMGVQLKLEANCIELKDNTVVTEGRIIANEKVCDTFLGTFIAVPETHPAYHRW
jgi:acyl-coenzyme A thioesterase PaaI-like protein